MIDFPGAVVALGVDEGLGEAGAKRMVVKAEEPQAQPPLRLHAAVGFGAADPMAVGLLAGQQPVGRGCDRGAQRSGEIGRTDGRARLHVNGCHEIFPAWEANFPRCLKAPTPRRQVKPAPSRMIER